MSPATDNLARVRASIDELLRGSRYGHFTDADRDRYRALRAEEAALLAAIAHDPADDELAG
jgi:hypothetical protein